MTSVSAISLADHLVSLFVAASEVAAQRVKQLGLPLTLPVVVTSIERDRSKPDGWESSERIAQLNILSHPNTPAFQIVPLLTPEVLASVRECAAELVKAEESNLPFWAPFQGNSSLLTDVGERVPHYPSDPVGWATQYIILPALQAHLMAMSRLDIAIEEAGKAFASDVLRLAMGDNLAYHLSVPLAGLDIDSGADVLSADDDTIIRRLSADEQGRLLKDWGILSTGISSFRSLPLVVLEISVLTGRYQHNPDARELIAKWLCAFQLHGYSIAGYYAVLEMAPRWALPMTMPASLTLPSRVHTWASLSGEELQAVRDTVSQLHQYRVNEPNSEHDLALHRFHLGNGRANGTDAVLDFVIALESLLLPYDEITRHTELGYRFRTHGAHYLASTASERRQVAKQLTDLYGVRSRLVHGSSYPTAAEIESQRKLATDFAKRGLLRAVHQGFPTATQFRDIVLNLA